MRLAFLIHLLVLAPMCLAQPTATPGADASMKEVQTNFQDGLQEIEYLSNVGELVRFPGAGPMATAASLANITITAINDISDDQQFGTTTASFNATVHAVYGWTSGALAWLPSGAVASAGITLGGTVAASGSVATVVAGGAIAAAGIYASYGLYSYITGGMEEFYQEYGRPVVLSVTRPAQPTTSSPKPDPTGGFSQNSGPGPMSELQAYLAQQGYTVSEELDLAIDSNQDGTTSIQEINEFMNIAQGRPLNEVVEELGFKHKGKMLYDYFRQLHLPDQMLLSAGDVSGQEGMIMARMKENMEKARLFAIKHRITRAHWLSFRKTLPVSLTQPPGPHLDARALAERTIVGLCGMIAKKIDNPAKDAKDKVPQTEQ